MSMIEHLSKDEGSYFYGPVFCFVLFFLLESSHRRVETDTVTLDDGTGCSLKKNKKCCVVKLCFV